MLWTKIGLVVLFALSLMTTLVLRRAWTRLSPTARLLSTLLPLLLTYVVSWLGIWLFVRLGRYGALDTHTGLAFASACVPTLLAALAPPRWRPLAAGVVLSAFALLLFADAIHYRFFGNILPLLAIGSAGHIWDVRDSVAALAVPMDLWLLPVAASGVALATAWPSSRRVPSTKAPGRVLLGACYLVPIVICTLGALPIKRDVDAYLAKSRSWKVFHVLGHLKSGGVIVAHARDIATTLRERRLSEELKPEQRARVEEYVRRNADEARRFREAPSYGALAETNVLMVQLEAIQQWAVDAEVNGEAVMPFLRSLKERSLYFPNLYDQTGGSPTSDCEYLVLNGLHPLERGAVSFRRAGNDFVAMPKLFAERGYHTLSAHAYAPGMWNRSVLHKRYGFKQSFFRDDFPPEEKLGWGMGDKPFFEHLAGFLEAAPKPFFAFAITLTSHHPYNYVPASVWRLSMKGAHRHLRDYLRSARYVDEALRELFGHLEAAGLLENTTVVLYGDHDAKLKFNQKQASAAAKYLNLDEGALRAIGRRGVTVDRVPLFIVPPPSRPLPAAVVETVGGQIDIGATVLHYFGVPAPPSFLGLPLLADREGAVFRIDGVALDATRLFRTRGKEPCQTRTPGADDTKPRCDDLRRGREEQVEVSTFITLHNLAAGLSRDTLVEDGSF